MVLGDLTLDVVLAPAVPLVEATDVPGRVLLRQGGSAANAARWMARSGARVTLVSAVGRDPEGRALVGALRSEGVAVRAVRVAGSRTGRIGILVDPGGERSFVADRGAADALEAADLRETWFGAIELLHLPAYSLLGDRLGRAGLFAAELAHARGALVTVDLASVVPLMAEGRRRAVEIVAAAGPDLLFATLTEARALAGEGREDRLLDVAPLTVLKRGASGATLLLRDRQGDTRRVLRLDVATRPVAARDTTGAGDAFDAGFAVAWLAARRDGLGDAAALRRAALAGHRLAARHLASAWPELRLG
jgi:sugar/nucleoside kinase (ribokinase family)